MVWNLANFRTANQYCHFQHHAWSIFRQRIYRRDCCCDCREILYHSARDDLKSIFGDTFPSSGNSIQAGMALAIGCRDRLSEFLLHVLADSVHITEILIMRQVATHYPAAMDSSSESEWEFDNSNRALCNFCRVQDDDISKQLVSSVCYRYQVSISLRGCSCT